jgi:uncharacterized protein YyaL (SSP411 family)
VTQPTASAPKHTNRLSNETSPYLLQHQHNPVDWYPWGDEALKKAKDENKPIFLSIGYSACHWCHVMEHESFENEEIAAILNEHFVSIKVDREERPDLDEIYMTAVQILTGSGGWPMSVFLTPDLKPFYGGTYYPPTDMHQRPGFKTVLLSLVAAWTDKRAEIDKSAVEITGYIEKYTKQETVAGKLSLDLVTIAAKDLAGSFDTNYGGFGGAPKFPSAPSIALLLREYARTKNEKLLHAATFTLRKMYQGGMYDHLGGGFHRYSVDAQWLVPHFEKMLYDNAQLAQVYLEAYQLTKDPLYKRVVEEIFEYQLRDMTDPQGGFHSTENADSEGEEGKFYVWTEDEIIKALGQDDGNLFCQYYSVRSRGNFSSHEAYHEGKNILHISRAPETIAKDNGLALAELEAKLKILRGKLMEVRDKRIRPSLDDKVLASWNGLMISAMAQGYQVLGDARYLAAAQKSADFVLGTMMKDGVLMRTYREGKAHVPAYLDDYAFMLNALVDLYEASFDIKWIDAANTLANAMVERFWDDASNSFYFSPAGQADLLVRTKPTYDGAEPSGNSMAALGLSRLAKLTANTELLTKATDLLEQNAEAMKTSPRAFIKMICAVHFLMDSPREVAIAGSPEAVETKSLLAAARTSFVPCKVVALVDPAWTNGEDVTTKIPLLQGKKLVDGKPAAYVCKLYTCKAPVTGVDELLKELGIEARQ